MEKYNVYDAVENGWNKGGLIILKNLKRNFQLQLNENTV